jgi:ClpP class serine protease
VLRIPVVRYINIDDSEDLLRAIRLTDKNTPLDLILHTPGGLMLAAAQIAKAIKRHPRSRLRYSCRTTPCREER